MIRSAGFLLVLLVSIVAGPILASSRHGVYVVPRRALSPFEALQKVMDEHDLVALVRVVFVAEEATQVPAEVPGIVLVRPAQLEVIEWFRGGLDGDAIDVVMYEGEAWNPVDPEGWHALAGVDTMGALVILDPDASGWKLGSDPVAGMPDGYLPVSQRRFRAVRDSVLHARSSLTTDSLVARADVVVVGQSQQRNANLDGLSGLTVERTLKGRLPGPTLDVRPLLPLLPRGRVLLFLKAAADGTWAPIPVHRRAWALSTAKGGPDPDFDAREAEVIAAVERWKARSGQR